MDSDEELREALDYHSMTQMLGSNDNMQQTWPAADHPSRDAREVSNMFRLPIVTMIDGDCYTHYYAMVPIST